MKALRAWTVRCRNRKGDRSFMSTRPLRRVSACEPGTVPETYVSEKTTWSASCNAHEWIKSSTLPARCPASLQSLSDSSLSSCFLLLPFRAAADLPPKGWICGLLGSSWSALPLPPPLLLPNQTPPLGSEPVHKWVGSQPNGLILKRRKLRGLSSKARPPSFLAYKAVNHTGGRK